MSHADLLDVNARLSTWLASNLSAAVHDALMTFVRQRVSDFGLELTPEIARLVARDMYDAALRLAEAGDVDTELQRGALHIAGALVDYAGVATCFAEIVEHA